MSKLIFQAQAVLSFKSAAAILGYSSGAAYVARRRQIFPIRVRQIGGKLVCFQADINEYLLNGETQCHLSVPALRNQVKYKTGRPKKHESLEAMVQGITVKELRARGEKNE